MAIENGGGLNCSLKIKVSPEHGKSCVRGRNLQNKLCTDLMHAELKSGCSSSGKAQSCCSELAT